MPATSGANPSPPGGSNPPATPPATQSGVTPQTQTPQTPQSPGLDPSPNPIVKIQSVNPPLTPDQVIGLYDTPVPKSYVPTIKLQDIKIPNVKNKTLQSHLKAIEAKMIATEKLMKDIVKLQRLQIITEKEVYERKKELYQNTFEEYLLDKTVAFENEDDKNKDCTCINLPKLAAAVPAAPVGGAPTPPTPPTPPDPPAPAPPKAQTRTRTPISQPSIPSTEVPDFVKRGAERTDKLMSMMGLLGKSAHPALQVLGQTVGAAGTAGFSQAWAKAWYQHYMNEEREYIKYKIKQILKLKGKARVGELNNIKIAKEKAAQHIQTPQAQKGSYNPSKYWREAHPSAAGGRKLEEFFQSIQGGGAEMNQFLAQSDYNITSNILNGFGTDYGEMRTRTTEEVIKRTKFDPKHITAENQTLDQTGIDKLQKHDPGMPASPPAPAATSPNNFASGGIPGGGDLKLYDAKPQTVLTPGYKPSPVVNPAVDGAWVRGSRQSAKIASSIPVGPHTPLPHPGYVRPQGGYIPRPNLRGMPGPLGNPMPWGWQPTLLSKGAVVSSAAKASGGLTDLELYHAQSQNYFRKVSNDIPKYGAGAMLKFLPAGINLAKRGFNAIRGIAGKGGAGKGGAGKGGAGGWMGDPNMVNPFRNPKQWWNLGRNQRIPNESTARLRTLIKDDLQQVGKFKTPTGYKGFNPWWSFTKGLGTGPTPIQRQLVERILPRFAGRVISAPVLGDMISPQGTSYYDQLSGPNAYYNAPGYKGPRPSERLETAQNNLRNNNSNKAPSVVPLPPNYIQIPSKKAKETKENKTMLTPPGVDSSRTIFSIESGNYK